METNVLLTREVQWPLDSYGTSFGMPGFPLNVDQMATDRALMSEVEAP